MCTIYVYFKNRNIFWLFRIFYDFGDCFSAIWLAVLTLTNKTPINAQLTWSSRFSTAHKPSKLVIYLKLIAVDWYIPAYVFAWNSCTLLSMHAICHVFLLESSRFTPFYSVQQKDPKTKKASIKFTSILTHVISIENHS